MNNEQILYQLQSICLEIKELRKSSPVDFGMTIICILLGLILWRVW